MLGLSLDVVSQVPPYSDLPGRHAGRDMVQTSVQLLSVELDLSVAISSQDDVKERPKTLETIMVFRNSHSSELLCIFALTCTYHTAKLIYVYK